jgi:aminoglycoside 6'-N-acetyltransferase I
MKIRKIVESDRSDWVRLRDALWPGSLSDHDLETRRYFESGLDLPVVFVADVDGRLVAFLELDYRKYAPGCASSPVPFIEGWYVEPAMRGRKIGRALVEAAEAHARKTPAASTRTWPSAMRKSNASYVFAARSSAAEVPR